MGQKKSGQAHAYNLSITSQLLGVGCRSGGRHEPSSGCSQGFWCVSYVCPRLFGRANVIARTNCDGPWDSFGFIRGAVPDAAITATNVTTGIERTTVTTDTGAYSIGSLAPSIYTFVITKPGFKVVKFENITVTVDQILTLDAKLEVGSTSTTIEVASTAVAPVDTESATLSNVVEHSQMTELPLILRDPYQLVLLGPGVTNLTVDSEGFP
jgi:hypothetical protein